MNQTAIGSCISKKRREKNLTQEQLAEKLGVSNKTISKWENGKCMPDYSIIEQVCRELSVTLPELMNGEDATDDSVRVYDEAQILDLLRRMQELERQKNILYGIILMVLGLACSAMSATASGSEVQGFVSGLLMGLSAAEILAGIVIVGKSILKRQLTVPHQIFSRPAAKKLYSVNTNRRILRPSFNTGKAFPRVCGRQLGLTHERLFSISLYSFVQNVLYSWKSSFSDPGPS